MAEVKILLEGYLDSESGGFTRPTISLVQDNNLKIIVDPGLVKDQQLIIGALKKEGLQIDDINIVFLTHSHLDHYRNIGMFKKAKTLEYFGLWNDKGGIIDYNSHFTKNIKIINTPGHNYDSLTMLVKTPNGVVAIYGDVFWKEDFPKIDEYASDNKELIESRKKVLKLADWIIPGHGKIFRVLRNTNTAKY